MNPLELIYGGFMIGLGFWGALAIIVFGLAIVMVAWAGVKQ
jgi:hypothetical protein